ncbi:rRNA small subunit methyltransferase G [Cynara cardunculus var. scolymus]|uniref:rRNA small subunit methyltransferase G n=1 Tax=Cynara cardunculus var. scolymus TaxID=59895 RepID=A0A103YC32_CYNCS|nr:rRNA small subunit methyltransferase G [Cynara cardunculus var. scolymus]
MLLLGNRIFNFPLSLSFGTFIKHLERASNLKPTVIIRRSTTTKSSIINASHFETLNPLQKQQVHLYVDALLDWNQKMNLTAVREASDVMDRHIEDSLAIIPPIQSSYVSHCESSFENLNLIDVGSGAGLPGLILAIACPGWQVTLLESINKRCVFLEHAVGLLGLSNVKVIRGRAEVCLSANLSSISAISVYLFSRKQYVGQNVEFREAFDVTVARAVAEMRILGTYYYIEGHEMFLVPLFELPFYPCKPAEYCLPLVRVGGLFVAAKGHAPEEEVRRAKKAISLMGASLLQTCYVNSHSPYGQRTAIICLKDGPTPKKYPRDPGTPAKLPL